MSACGESNFDSDLIVGLPFVIYASSITIDNVSNFCFNKISITNPLNNITVIAIVVDDSGDSDLSLSLSTWLALVGNKTDLS